MQQWNAMAVAQIVCHDAQTSLWCCWTWSLWMALSSHNRESRWSKLNIPNANAELTEPTLVFYNTSINHDISWLPMNAQEVMAQVMSQMETAFTLVPNKNYD